MSCILQLYSGLDIGGTVENDAEDPPRISDPYCIVKFNGLDIARSEKCTENYSEPFWNENIKFDLSTFDYKVNENHRPFLFEYLDVEVFGTDENTNANVYVGATRVKLVNFEQPEWYRVISKAPQSKYSGRLLIGITVKDYADLPKVKLLPLSTLLPPCLPQYSQLYIDFQADSLALLGLASLPGPSVGEVVIDRYNSTQWKIAVGNNAFGDKYYVNCTGTLYVTDLRVIFLPTDVDTPSWSGLPCIHADQTLYTAEELLLIRRTTFQMPLCAMQECRIRKGESSSWSDCSLIFEGRDNTSTEIIIKSPIDSTPTSRSRMDSADRGTPGNSRPPSGAVPDLGFLNSRSRSSLRRSTHLHMLTPSALERLMKRNSADCVERGAGTDLFVEAFHYKEHNTEESLEERKYYNGLDTDSISPRLWCARAQEMIQWLIKEDYTWLRWSKYLQKTCEESANFIDKDILRQLKDPINIDLDYSRLHVLEAQWNMTDINISYDICTTYPQTLVLPGSLSKEEIKAGATQRSRGRLPVLVWLHPQTHAPLCRSAQPVVGMSGMPEHDKKVCVAIKTSCSSGLPLRIADARPRLNAQANAMQGKGYENINFLGGPSVASLTFLDIDNIHVMRNSLAKLRENSTAASTNNASDATTTAGSSLNVGNDNITSSKWLPHVSNVLRGAIGLAESLLLGHPVLVHCSDGWDRTAQLCALTQILLDPYYRTIDGFLLLIRKEWCSFGHKFEDRLGHTEEKETSPVFLQFLDCVYQLCVQFPTDFAFSAHFLTIFSYASYSGFFTTFKENNERDRYNFMRSIFLSERLNPEDLEFSSVFCYMKVLLHSNISGSLTNPHYHVPSTRQSQLKYLRPRYVVSDLVLWREGLFGLNQPNFKGYMPNSLTAHECAAISSSAAARYFDYVALHDYELSKQTARQLNAFLNNGDHIVPNIPYTLRSTNNYFSIMTGRNANIPFAKLNPMEVACVRVQLWFRARRSVNIAVDSAQVQFTRVRVKKILHAIVWSELKLKYMLRLRDLALTHLFVRNIVDDTLEEALTFCIRKEAAVARIIEYEATPLNNSMIIASGSSSAGVGKKLFSSVTGRFNGIVGGKQDSETAGSDGTSRGPSPGPSGPGSGSGQATGNEKRSMFNTIFRKPQEK